MLEKLSLIPEGTESIIIYSQSPTLDFFVKEKLKRHFKMHKDFVVDVATDKEINKAKLDSYASPMFCERWMINVNADKANKKGLEKALSVNTAFGVTVYWTSKYGVYKSLINMDAVKKRANACKIFMLSRLEMSDIDYLYHEIVPEKHRTLERSLFVYLCSAYKYDVQAVMQLFEFMRTGDRFDTKREIIDTVGIGGVTVDSLVVKMLMYNPGTERGRDTAISQCIKLLNDLNTEYQYHTIRNFMISTLDGFLEMKYMILSGAHRNQSMEIPPNFDEKRMNRLKRFRFLIKDSLSVDKILNLKICLLKNMHVFESEIALLGVIYDYYSLFDVKVDEKKSSNVRKISKKKEKERERPDELNTKTADVTKIEKLGSRDEDDESEESFDSQYINILEMFTNLKNS